MSDGSGLVALLREAEHRGINQGTSGNASVRAPGGMHITPSGVPYDQLGEHDLIFVSDNGSIDEAAALRPSSEWRMHLGVYVARPDVEAVVHLHSPAASALAALREPLPPFHYMVCAAGGDHVPCAPYALFGTEALAQVTVQTLGSLNAVLLANHGMLACGTDARRAFDLAVEIEALCDAYLRARAAGDPVLLSEAEMQAVRARFATYR